MAPKYRGDGEDWLENQSDPQRKKTSQKKSHTPVWDQVRYPVNGLVVQVFRNQAQVLMDAQGDQPAQELLCTYRRALVLGSKAQPTLEADLERSPVVVGDRVAAEPLNPQQGVIYGVEPRKNSFLRSMPGRQAGVHVLGANLDLVVVVASTQRPTFTRSMVDRFLVAAELERLPAAVCFTKWDLLEPPPAVAAPVFSATVPLNESAAAPTATHCLPGKEPPLLREPESPLLHEMKSHLHLYRSLNYPCFLIGKKTKKDEKAAGSDQEKSQGPTQETHPRPPQQEDPPPLAGEDWAQLQKAVAGKRVLYCGQSGVGKTSLLRRLMQDADYGRIDAVSERSGLGRHTTTSSRLTPNKDGGFTIDTPGIREFTLKKISAQELALGFPEMQLAANRCPDSACLHDDGARNCQKTTLPRYASYRKLLAELKEQEHD